MTAVAYQSLRISDDTKERLNRLVIGFATNLADNIRKRGSRWSIPADLQLGGLGQVAAGVLRCWPG